MYPAKVLQHQKYQNTLTKEKSHSEIWKGINEDTSGPLRPEELTSSSACVCLRHVVLCCVQRNDRLRPSGAVHAVLKVREGEGGQRGRPLLLIATHMCSAEVGLQISVCATPPPSVWMLPTQTVGWPLWLLQIWLFSALLKLATCSHAWTMTEEGTLG